MEEYPKTLAALREQNDRSWPVADALVAEISSHPDGRVLNGEYSRCAAWLKKNGYEATPNYLARMREVAQHFLLSESRKWKIPFRLYMAAAQSGNWTPELMDRAEREHMTLREFSRALTGKSWSDDHKEPPEPTRLDVLSALARAKQSIQAATRMAAQANLSGTRDEGIAQLGDEISEALSVLIRLNSGSTLSQELEDILKGE